MRTFTTLVFVILSALAYAQKIRTVRLFRQTMAVGTPKADFEWHAIQNYDWPDYDVEIPEWVYNPETHTYAEDYVHPKGYRISLDARKSTLPKELNARYPTFHWKIEKITSRQPIFFGGERERLETVYETAQAGLPVLLLTKAAGEDAVYKIREGATAPDGASSTPVRPHGPLAFEGPMLPSTGNYKVTLQIIDEFTEDGRPKIIASVTKNILLKDFVIVIFGDSNASGEGNPESDGSYGGSGIDSLSVDLNDECNGGTFSEVFAKLPDSAEHWVDAIPGIDTTIHRNRKVVWMDYPGHRSTKSGHFLAARKLSTSPHIFVTILSFANSGASYANGMIGPQFDHQDVGQIEEAKRTLRGRPVDFVLMSQGINELDFEAFISRLMIGGWIEYFFTGDGHQVPRDMVEKLESIDRKVGGLCERIKSTFPNPQLKVYVTEYPEGVFQNESEDIDVDCGMFGGFFLGISDIEALIVAGVNKELNARVRRAVRFKTRVELVDGIASKFRQHGYCSTTPFFVHHDESCHRQGDFRGVLHPNNLGHKETAALIYERLERDIKVMTFKNGELEF